MNMKTMKNLSFLLVLLISLTSCAKRYSNTEYNEHVIRNKTIAVLPYQVITTGRIPENVTEEMLLEIEAAESRAFQASLHHQILNRLNRRRYRSLNIGIQSYDETNRLLRNADIDIQQSWDISSKELADLLGVDAVVRSTVHKNKYLTDLESYGIYLAHSILINFTNRYYWFLSNNKTSDVRISTTIIDASNGKAIWAASRKCPTDWNNNTYDVIERINYRISKRLPR